MRTTTKPDCSRETSAPLGAPVPVDPIIAQARAAYAKNPNAAPLIHTFVNIYEGWDWQTEKTFHDAIMCESRDEAAEGAIEPHYRGTILFNPDNTVTPLDLSARGEELFRERQRRSAEDRRYESACASYEAAGRAG